jgi:hypothetical protein
MTLKTNELQSLIQKFGLKILVRMKNRVFWDVSVDLVRTDI